MKSLRHGAVSMDTALFVPVQASIFMLVDGEPGGILILADFGL